MFTRTTATTNITTVLALGNQTKTFKSLCALFIIYATADEADAYMFYRCFFLFSVFFRPSQKYQTTVLGNG